MERPDSAGSPLDRRPMSGRRGSGDAGPEEHDDPADDRTPLLASPQPMRTEPMYDLHPAPHRRDGGVEHAGRRRRPSGDTSVSSRRRRRAGSKQRPRSSFLGEYDVNNPPSVPASPLAGPDMSYEDVMIPKDFNLLDSPQQRAKILSGGGDALIDINEVEADNDGYGGGASPQAPRNAAAEHRKRTMVLTAQEDVCFPHDGLSETAEEDSGTAPSRHDQPSSRRRRRKVWPDLSVLEEWSLEEKEERSEEIRAKKISEPVLVGGRLRPNNHGWHRLEEDAPFRFTYFNEDLPSTIHSQTISELLQPDQTFRDLFIPEPPELTDDEWEDDDDYVLQDRWHEQQQQQQNSHYHQNGRANGESKSATRHPSVASEDDHRQHGSSFDGAGDGDRTPREKPKRYGPRPVFWLDVLSPTDAEMRVIAKAFGIHPLTAEDIMMQEAREKVELFRNYYFVNYRTFEQDGASEDHLDPINMSMVVFREGVISVRCFLSLSLSLGPHVFEGETEVLTRLQFHFTMIPHPANVRRRIRQLKDYLIPSSDWISYAIIDDITDAFAPLSHQLEEEVDAIEDTILGLHSPPAHGRPHPSPSSKKSEAGDGKTGDGTTGDIGGDLLRRVGDCRKRVMGLYRLLGNKADVIKGFAKRCNEQWEVAPRSEIGLYLGDIQDHIVTMTSNLGHYERYFHFISSRLGSFLSTLCPCLYPSLPYHPIPITCNPVLTPPRTASSRAPTQIIWPRSTLP